MAGPKRFRRGGDSDSAFPVSCGYSKCTVGKPGGQKRSPPCRLPHASDSDSSESCDGTVGNPPPPRRLPRFRSTSPSSESCDWGSDDGQRDGGGISNVRRNMVVIELITSSSEDTKAKKLSASSKKKGKEKMDDQEEKRLGRIWMLREKLASTDEKISVLEQNLKQEKTKKKALQRALAEAQRKASNK